MTTTHSSPWLGVDLGTCNSSAALRLRAHQVVPVHNSESVSTDASFLAADESVKSFPSFILFAEDGAVAEVGLSAKQRAAYAPERVVWGIKRLLGRSYSDLKESGELERFPYRIRPNRKNGQCLVVVGERSHEPEALCAEVFRRIKHAAEQRSGQSMDSVVVSVPAYFDPLRVSPIIQAAKSAGFVHVKTIPEPVAAALAYDIEVSPRPLKVIVFDLGAGTLDVTAGYLYRQPDQDNEYQFQVAKNTGDTRLGGMDMDDRLLRLLLERCQVQSMDAAETTYLRRQSELAKIQLSSQPGCTLQFSLRGTEYSWSVSRLDLQTALEGSGVEKNLIEDARRQLMAALVGAEWQPQDVECLILIGGPTRLPCIQDMLRIVFTANAAVLAQIERFYSGDERVDRMAAVATGAALSLDRRADDRVPAGYGIEDFDVDGDTMVHYASILVPPDSAYPCRSQHHVIRWTNVTGLFEFKVLQQVPGSEVPQFGYRYRFVGLQKFAVKNPDLCMIAIQMGYNANKELEVTFTNALTGETVTYQGVIQSASIGMNYPLRVKRPPNIHQNPLRRAPPPQDTLKTFLSWTGTTVGYIQRKADNHQLPHMQITQKLDEIGVLMKHDHADARYEAVFTQVQSLIWNASSAGILSQTEYVELSNHLSSFETDLFRVATQ